MSYLTQVLFDPDMVTRLRIRDAYDWHQRTWECFPGRDGATRDYLTRLEDKGSYLSLLVLSPVPPTRPDWCPAPNWRGTKDISEGFLAHRRYRFQLCANPTRKVKAFNQDGSERRNGRRVPLRGREELVAWLLRKGTAGGFKVDEVSLKVFPRRSEPFERKGRSGLHASVEFIGALTVEDARKFAQTFVQGIGPAKSFGFGLLALVPLV